MEYEKFKLHIDTVKYRDKQSAKKDMKIIKTRLQCSSAVETTIKELAEAVQQGKTISPAVMLGTESKHFVEQQAFLVDIDNSNTDIPFLTVEKALEICRKNHLPPVFYYYTFSYTKTIPKYRLVFLMDEVITDRILRDTIMQRLIELFEQADTSCRNADRVFLGTDKEVAICDLEARITRDTILKLPPKSITVKKKKSHRADKELEQLVNDFDFFGYLKERNGKLSCDNSIYAMFETCEICGHHDDLVYYKETNSFFCFSDDGNVGGSIIDYLIAVEKIAVPKAINIFKYELCGLSKPSKKLELICMEDIVEQEVKWLWYPYIPAGKITILQGDPR